MRERLLLGAPGVYPVADDPVRALTGVRMDVAAFVGVAPRGPARLPAYLAPWAVPPRGPGAPTAPLRSVAVPVESWSAYRRLFGGFEGPGLLPYAVAAFFEQGGRRAYVVRVVHDYGEGHADNAHGTASGVVPGVTVKGVDKLKLTLLARSEGSWGNRLRATLSFRTRPLPFQAAGSTGGELVLEPGAPVPVGTLLRLWEADGTAALRFVSEVRDPWRADRPVRERRAKVEGGDPLSPPPARAEIVEADLAVTDLAADGIDRAELHERMGLSPEHPRWLAAVLYRDSSLVYPDPAWIGKDLLVDDATLRAPPEPPTPQFTCGRDRYEALVPADCFDYAWTPGDEQPRGGVHALVELDEVSIVCVPDLYAPGPLVKAEQAEDVVSLAGPRFAPCVELERKPVAPPSGVICDDLKPAEPDGSAGSFEKLLLDPADPGDLETIVTLQQELVALAELLETWVVLLDVPPGLTHRQVLDWRGRFGSAWAAGYHPWLRVSRPDDTRDPLVAVPPSAFAAGVVARQEQAFGVPHGPANALVVGAVSVLDAVSPLRHDELHQAAVNVFVRERDGVRLTAARTLSRDPQWRQLSVRRLMSLLRKTLLRQMQWTVFEPNGPLLRDELTRMLEIYLGQLFLANAFRGRAPDEAFFVRCDDELNPPWAIDTGRLLCLVGVAPAEPLEFIVLKLSREGDGTLLMEE